MNETTNPARVIPGRQASARFRSPARRLGRLTVWGFLVAVLSVGLIGQPAWADGGGQSTSEGYVMVQQALSYLVNEPSPTGTAAALDRVNAALAAADQDGVAVADVEQAKVALTAGDTKTAQTLLQGSIKDAIAALKPAVGEQTGTTIMLAPFTQGPIAGTDWLFLVLSVLAAVGGAILAMWLRPREGLRDLSRDILADKGMRHETSHLETNGSEDDAR